MGVLSPLHKGQVESGWAREDGLGLPVWKGASKDCGEEVTE